MDKVERERERKARRAERQRAQAERGQSNRDERGRHTQLTGRGEEGDAQRPVFLPIILLSIDILCLLSWEVEKFLYNSIILWSFSSSCKFFLSWLFCVFTQR